MPRWITFAAVAGALLAGGVARAGDGGFVTEAAHIRALRAANNQALAEHRVEDVMSIAADDYVLVGGDDGVYRSKAEMTRVWRENFADAGNRGCVRTTEQVQVGEAIGILRAAESGRWECVGGLAGSERVRSGRYFAHWTKRSGQWRVVSDTYVTLRCVGTGCETH